jgi:hypothetical protein
MCSVAPSSVPSEAVLISFSPPVEARSTIGFGCASGAINGFGLAGSREPASPSSAPNRAAKKLFFFGAGATASGGALGSVAVT